MSEEIRLGKVSMKSLRWNVITSSCSKCLNMELPNSLCTISMPCDVLAVSASVFSADRFNVPCFVEPTVVVGKYSKAPCLATLSSLTMVAKWIEIKM